MRRKSLMFTSVAAICFAAASFLAVDANYGKDREKDLLTKNLEALSENEESDGCYATMGYDCDGWGSINYKCFNRPTAERCSMYAYNCCK